MKKEEEKLSRIDSFLFFQAYLENMQESNNNLHQKDKDKSYQLGAD